MSMFYDNLGNESAFRLLADVASTVEEEEEEERRLVAEKRAEESKKRIFYLCPRKIRSSLVKIRHEQQDLCKASTSSSLLLNLNIIPSDSAVTENQQNPSSDEPTVLCDEEQRRKKKGKSKMVCEDDDYEEYEKKFVFKRFSKQSFDHLNGASTSSSFLDLRCFETSDESEKTETKDPPNPNYQSSSPSSCLTENTSRKRRAVSQHKQSSTSVKFNKAKIAPLPKIATTETPEWVYQVMKDMTGGADETPRLICERELTASDVNSTQSRLLIPFKKLIRNDFLTPLESQAVHDTGVETILVNQKFETWDLRFKVWAMKKKESGNRTLNYSLNRGWNNVVEANDLKADDKISLWTFRCREVLCFALDTE